MIVFLLLASAALTGCQTSKPSSSQSTAGNSSSITKSSRHHVSTTRPTAKDTKVFKPEAGQTNTPAKLAAIPVPPPSQTPITPNDSVAAKIDKQPAISESHSTTPAATQLTAGNPAPPDFKPESADRSSLTVPGPDINLASPARARVSMDTSSRATTPPDKIPSAVNLSYLDSPTAGLSAPHQPAVIRLPTFDDHTPDRTAPLSLKVLFRPAMPDKTFDSQANPQGLRLASAAAPISLQTVCSNQSITLPLPVPPPVSWQTDAQSAAPTPGLSNWLASPAPAPQPAPVTTREARDTLHQKIYNLLLGN